MPKFNSEDFIEKYKTKNPNALKKRCPICGHNHFTTTDFAGKLIINEDTNGLNIGPNIPVAMIICENCGYMELYALGTYQKINNEDEETKDGSKN